jgi:hypothetical protein
MVTTNLPSYLYQQYNNDPDVLAFFTAYNTFSQTNLDTLNSLSLPIYTSKSGALLDWVASSIYGTQRPILPYLGTSQPEVYNQAIYNTTIYNTNKVLTSDGYFTVNDDFFKRILTWNFYKGDGFQFNTAWLKNRIYRFLGQPNGIALPIPDTYEISVSFAPNDVVNIYINAGALAVNAPIFQAAVNSGAINLPFQYTFNVTY